jgi:hypothetical protein
MDCADIPQVKCLFLHIAAILRSDQAVWTQPGDDFFYGSFGGYAAMLDAAANGKTVNDILQNSRHPEACWLALTRMSNPQCFAMQRCPGTKDLAPLARSNLKKVMDMTGS